MLKDGVHGGGVGEGGGSDDDSGGKGELSSV